jgi:hypothetical protein
VAASWCFSASFLDRVAEQNELVVDVAKHEVSRPAIEEPHDVNRADIAAMQHHFNFAAFEHPNGLPGICHVSVRIADDADKHS